jgi:uncharacterized lipoprotein YddW (UPF0748 family)
MEYLLNRSLLRDRKETGPPARFNGIRHAALWYMSLCLLADLASISSASTYDRISLTPPKPVREMRGVWVASVGNIDWPSTNAITTAQQKVELIAILDRAVQMKLNTILLQVRPACDALYASRIEPWSEYLTGTMGKPPQPFYDPLSFAVEEAHRRALELHAWFNPFRARHLAAKSPIAANHVSRTKPQWVRQYGKSLWLDPGEKGAQDYSLSVVMDVVQRYDIDGVHFDDYFYPYQETNAAGKELDFPDYRSWRNYGAGGRLSRSEWRRENINTFVHRAYHSIKGCKPWVKFGISPFGIWRPGSPASVRGFDPFDKLYADSRKWLNEGWVDYFVPQLYWRIDAPEQSFTTLLEWWSQQNFKGRLLLAGMDDTRTTRTLNPWGTGEIVSQIRATRRAQGVAGHVHWNMKTLLRNGALSSALEREVYSDPALVPATPWLGSQAPASPKATPTDEEIRWEPGARNEVARWLVQRRKDDAWTTLLLPATQTTFRFGSAPPDIIAITTVDRYGNLSRPAIFQRQGTRP